MVVFGCFIVFLVGLWLVLVGAGWFMVVCGWFVVGFMILLCLDDLSLFLILKIIYLSEL